MSTTGALPDFSFKDSCRSAPHNNFPQYIYHITGMNLLPGNAAPKASCDNQSSRHCKQRYLKNDITTSWWIMGKGICRRFPQIRIVQVLSGSAVAPLEPQYPTVMAKIAKSSKGFGKINANGNLGWAYKALSDDSAQGIVV